MSRHVRIDLIDGWYHVTACGFERREVFKDERDCGHFLELIEAMVSRYKALAHAYVLMSNHYHLLIQTPEANASRALQWLNVSYGRPFATGGATGGVTPPCGLGGNTAD